MNKPMIYQGYTAKIEYDAEVEAFLGEVIDLNDIITFSGNSVDELKQSFKDSVDAYIEYCEQNGEEPERPFSGKFSVRIEPELHKSISRHATLTGKSINTFVSEALMTAVSHNSRLHGPQRVQPQWSQMSSFVPQSQEQAYGIQIATPYYSGQSKEVKQ